MKVANKKEWYALQKAGIFNTTLNSSVEEFLTHKVKWHPDKIFCIRTMGGGGGQFICKPLFELVGELGKQRDQWPNIRVSEQAPDDAIQVQGEFNGEWATISFVQKPMRFAFREQELTVSKMQLLGLIGYEFYHHLQDLLEDFDPGHVVEWSLYSRPVGVFKERMIIWEVRHY